MGRNKEMLLLTLKLAEAQRRQQKAQAFVDYLCYEKGLLPGAKTFEQMVDELKN